MRKVVIFRGFRCADRCLFGAGELLQHVDGGRAACRGIDPANFDKSVRPQDDLFWAERGLARQGRDSRRSPQLRRLPPLAEQAEKTCHIVEAAPTPRTIRRARRRRRSATCMRRTWTKHGRSNSASADRGNAREDRPDRNKADLVRTLAELERVGVSGRWAAMSAAMRRSRIEHHPSIPGGPRPSRSRLLLGSQVKAKLAAYTAHVERMLSWRRSRRQAGGR